MATIIHSVFGHLFLLLVVARAEPQKYPKNALNTAAITTRTSASMSLGFVEGKGRQWLAGPDFLTSPQFERLTLCWSRESPPVAAILLGRRQAEEIAKTRAPPNPVLVDPRTLDAGAV